MHAGKPINTINNVFFLNSTEVFNTEQILFMSWDKHFKVNERKDKTIVLNGSLQWTLDLLYLFLSNADDKV